MVPANETRLVFILYSFRKWVLAYNYGVINDRVQEYNIGECSEEGIDNIERAFNKLVYKINCNQYPKVKTDAFVENNSMNTFKEFIDQVCNLYT